MKFVLLTMISLGLACTPDVGTDTVHAAAGLIHTQQNVPLTVCQPQYDQGGGVTCVLDRCDNTQGCTPSEDLDCDGHVDTGEVFDNCVQFCNPGQENADGDYMGDACDPCPQDSGNDIDKDGLCANADNCPHVANQAQANADGDAYGDACDELPNTSNPETVIAALDTRLDALEAAGTPAAIAALQYDIAALSAALAEIRTKYPQHYHGLLGLNGNPVGNSGDLNYSLPGDP